MASLGLPGGGLAPGEPADLVAYDLDDPALAGARPDDLLTHLVFAAGPRAVRHVWVAGEAVVRDGEPARVDAAAVIAAGRAALARLAGGA
jgi:cytosine/adenosine deaminase-related metal-dependent hydrolase